MYRVIACGVNRGPAAKALSYAEKDASDIADLFRGSLGPPVSDNQVTLLTGDAATQLSIELEIIRASLFTGTRYLVLYFSGHGNRDGVLTSNGILPYDSIIKALQLASVPFTTVILDVCFAASYLKFIKEARVGGLAGLPNLQLQWLQALADATPGTRLVFSTGADRLSGESSQLQNGLFTHSLLTALKGAPGDLAGNGCTWISDQRAFSTARRILASITGGKQEPVERGLTGDFPMAISQADAAVGDASFGRTSIDPSTLGVQFELEGRRHVETTLSWQLINLYGDEISRGQSVVEATQTSATFRGRIDCPHAAILADPVSRLQRTISGAAPLEWVLSLSDAHGHVLDQKVVPVKFRW